VNPALVAAPPVPPEIESITWPRLGPNQAWMWQTMLNGLTFHPNFAREVRAGRLRLAWAQSRVRFAVDTVVTVGAAQSNHARTVAAASVGSAREGNCSRHARGDRTDRG